MELCKRLLKLYIMHLYVPVICLHRHRNQELSVEKEMSSSIPESPSRAKEQRRSSKDSSSRSHVSSGHSDHRRSHGSHHHHSSHRRSHRSSHRDSHHRHAEVEGLSSTTTHHHRSHSSRSNAKRNDPHTELLITQNTKFASEIDEFPGYTVVEAPDFTDDEVEYEEGILQKRFQEGLFEQKVAESFTSSGRQNESENDEKTNHNRFVRDISQETNQVRDDAISNISSKKSVLDVNYTFGDRGSNWRMLKLNKCFEMATEEGMSIEEVASRRYGSPVLFYIAMEEKEELSRRHKQRLPESEWILKPTGSIAIQKGFAIDANESTANEGNSTEHSDSPLVEVSEDMVNEAKISMMRAKLQKRGNYNDLLESYQTLQKQFDDQKNRIKSGQNTAVYHDKAISLEDMTINEMIREEKLTTSREALKQSAKAIAVDTKFEEDLEAQDDNASKLARLSKTGKINIKDIAEMTSSSSSMKRYNRALDNCVFCVDNDSRNLPVISMATSCYLTLASQPELTKYGCIIVPFSHQRNTLSLSSDENEEIRNYMKTLSRFYYQELKQGVIFYESAITDTNHACIKCVPIPVDFGPAEIKGFFKQGILELVNEDQSNHNPIIDTLSKSETLGRSAMSSLISKEAPYFHVWIDMNGGIGHIVEDVQNWPKGDRFARGIICGMLDLDPFLARDQTRKPFNNTDLLTKFQAIYKKYDWVSE